jgi:hypothetical protein
MPLDSTANLLFTIGANADDAQSNVQAFRTLLSKDLSDVGAEFEAFSSKVFGDMSTMQGALLGGGAAIAAGLVAAGAAAVHCADQYAEYVESVAKVSKITGIAVEDVSRLKFAVEATGGNFDTAGAGLAKFTANVVKGAEGVTQQAAAFERLGITRAQLQAGEHDLLPLLEAVADKFQGLKDKTDRTTEARDLFGRSGTQFLSFLALGSDGLKQMANEADRLGLIIGQKDVEALHAYQAAMAEMKATQEAVDITVGRETLPLMTNLKMAWGALIQTMAQGGGANGSTFAATWAANLAAMKVSAEGLAESLGRIGKNQLTPPADDAPKAEKAKETWYGLSGVLEQVKTKLAAVTSEEAKVAEETDRLTAAAERELEQLEKLDKEGKLAPGVYDREAEAAQDALALIPALYEKLMADIAEKRRAAGEKAYSELLWDADRRRRAQAEAAQSEWQAELLEGIRKADAEKVAFDTQMAALAQHLERIQQSHQTAEERIKATYADDVAHFVAAEEKKALAAKTSDAGRAAVAAQYAAIRAALLKKEDTDLQALHNSQGWRGVFGSEFAQMIRGNEALSKEWASSTNQSLMMVRVTMEGLKEVGEQTFQALTRGMGQNIAAAWIYKKSIGEAMKAALEATLENLAGQAMGWAIYSLAMGFTDLAVGDTVGAAAAFEAAAIWGAVGGVAAIAARAMAPPQAASGGAMGASAPGSSPVTASGSGSGGTGSAAAGNGYNLTVIVQGNAYTVDPLIDAINEAVTQRDKALTATNTTTGQVVYR